MSQTNLIIQSGVHSSLHSNCHHQTIFAKFNLEVVYPPPYVRNFWHYKDANTKLIRRAINEFNQQRTFLNPNVNEKVYIFKNTILNILINLIPLLFVVCDDKDPPWFLVPQENKSINPRKNIAFKNYRNNSSNINLKWCLINLRECFY